MSSRDSPPSLQDSNTARIYLCTGRGAHGGEKRGPPPTPIGLDLATSEAIMRPFWIPFLVARDFANELTDSPHESRGYAARRTSCSGPRARRPHLSASCDSKGGRSEYPRLRLRRQGDHDGRGHRRCGWAGSCERPKPDGRSKGNSRFGLGRAAPSPLRSPSRRWPTVRDCWAQIELSGLAGPKARHRHRHRGRRALLCSDAPRHHRVRQQHASIQLALRPRMGPRLRNCALPPASAATGNAPTASPRRTRGQMGAALLAGVVEQQKWDVLKAMHIIADQQAAAALDEAAAERIPMAASAFRSRSARPSGLAAGPAAAPASRSTAAAAPAVASATICRPAVCSFEGAAACSWNLPFGTKLTIHGDPTGRTYECLDPRARSAPTWGLTSTSRTPRTASPGRACSARLRRISRSSTDRAESTCLRAKQGAGRVVRPLALRAGAGTLTSGLRPPPLPQGARRRGIGDGGLSIRACGAGRPWDAVGPFGPVRRLRAMAIFEGRAAPGQARRAAVAVLLRGFGRPVRRTRVGGLVQTRKELVTPLPVNSRHSHPPTTGPSPARTTSSRSTRRTSA